MIQEMDPAFRAGAEQCSVPGPCRVKNRGSTGVRILVGRDQEIVGKDGCVVPALGLSIFSTPS